MISGAEFSTWKISLSVIAFLLVAALLYLYCNKASHFYHWKDYEKSVTGRLVAGDPTMPPSGSGFYSRFMQSNVWWKKAAIIQPSGYEGPYQVGYVASLNGVRIQKICTIVFTGKVAMQVGREDVIFFAIKHPGGEEVPLQGALVIEQKWLSSDIPLL